MKRPLIAMFALALAGCTQPEAEKATAPSEAATPVPDAVKVDFSNARAFSGPDTFSVVIPHDATRSSVERAARDRCEGKDFCKVLGWSDPDLLPRGFPMTDREVEGQIFAYSLNRQSGLDEAKWLCEAKLACPAA